MKGSKLLVVIINFFLFFVSAYPKEEFNPAYQSFFEFHFVRGYQEFLNKNYAHAADLFNESILAYADGDVLNRSYLYLSICQFKLRDISNSAYHASLIDPDILNKKDSELFERLKKSLGEFYVRSKNQKVDYENKIKKRMYFTTPYTGRTSFENLSEREFSYFYGLGFSTYKKNWTFGLAGEKLDLQAPSSNSSFEQTLFNMNIRYSDEIKNFVAYVTSIYSPIQKQDGILVLGGGSKNNLLDKFDLISEISYLKHPNFEVEPIRAFQFKLDFQYHIFQNSVDHFYITLGLQNINISKYNDRFQTIKSGNHLKLSTEANFKFDEFILNANFWTGSETLGVRNQGVVVFSGVEEHLNGYGSKLNFPITDLLSGEGGFLIEKIKMKEEIGQSNTFFISLIYTYF